MTFTHPIQIRDEPRFVTDALTFTRQLAGHLPLFDRHLLNAGFNFDETSLDDLVALFEDFLVNDCRNSMTITNRNQRQIVRLLLAELREAR